MSEQPVYVVANIVVTDQDEYQKYGDGFMPLLKRYQGRIVTIDDRSETFEGSTPLSGRVIILSFPTEKSARNWYSDSEYQQLSAHRRAGTSLQFLTMVHSLPAR